MRNYDYVLAALFKLFGPSVLVERLWDLLIRACTVLVIYLIVGIVMLKRGWMNRYLPPIALELVPDIAIIVGYAWSGLMFFSAGLNLVVALNFSVATWSAAMSIWGIASKLALFLVQYVTMRAVGGRRGRVRPGLRGPAGAGRRALRGRRRHLGRRAVVDGPRQDARVSSPRLIITMLVLTDTPDPELEPSEAERVVS